MRNTKQIQNPNSQCSKSKMFETYTHRHRHETKPLLVFCFGHSKFRVFEFVSDFEFRHSDLKCKYLQIPPSRALSDASRYAGGALTLQLPNRLSSCPRLPATRPDHGSKKSLVLHQPH